MGQIATMLKRDNVQVVARCKDWRDAVHVAVQPLVDDGCVTPAYIDGIIENAETYGPYFVLAPDLALLHARPDQGVIERQLAVTISQEGVVFREGDSPVRVLVTLAATDANSHIDVMRELAQMFSDPASIERLATASSADEVYDLFISS